MFCTNCGKQLPDDARFCTQCGQKILPPVRNTGDTSESPDPAPVKKSRFPVFLCAGAAAAMLVGAGAAMILHPGNRNPESDQIGSAAVTAAAEGETSASQQAASGDKNTSSSGQTASKKKKESKDDANGFHVVESWRFEDDVSYCTEYCEYSYNENGKLVSVKSDIGSDREYKWDENGNLLEEYKYKKWVLDEGYQYEYDPTGTYVVAYNAQGVWGVSRAEYVFDDNGNIVREIVTDENGDPAGYIEHTYDSKNRVLTDRRFHEDGTTGDYAEYTYDEDGSYTQHYYRDDDMHSYTITVYNADGKEISYERGQEGGIILRREAVYDEEGRCLSDGEYTYSLGKLTISDTETYTYDVQGRLVQKVNHVQAGENDNTYNYYEEYDSYGNMIHSVSERYEYEYYFVYENALGVRSGDDFDHRGVSE